MSLFRGPIRPPPVRSDEAVERYLRAYRAGLEPDAAFRRRLRGHLVNRFVATREGHRPGGGAVKREMTRIGRAVLYSSFLLGLSVSSVMAASQHAIPGEILYPLKRQIEDVRLRVLPAHLAGELAAHNLGQRIEELHRLADGGRWDLVTAHAVAVEDAYEAVMTSGTSGTLSQGRVIVINSLIEQLPDATRSAVERVMSGIGQDGLPAADAGASEMGSEPPGGNLGGGNNDGTNPNGTTNAGGSSNDGSSGSVPDHASTNNSSNAAEPPRGGPHAADDDEAEEPEQPSEGLKPMKGSSPTPSPQDTER